MAREEQMGLDGKVGDPSFATLWQRERLLNAMVEEVTAKGLQTTTIASVSARARLPEEAFAAHFAGMEECYIAAFDSLIGQLAARTISAYHAPCGSWLTRVRAGLCTYICCVCARPDAARAYLLEAPTISAATRLQREQALALFEDTIAEMLEDLPTGAQLTPVTITAIAGGIARVVERRLREGRAAELPGLVEDMLAWALTYIPEAELIPEARELVQGAERGLALLG
jgi:AcrR family transcriptional regulator